MTLGCTPRSANQVASPLAHVANTIPQLKNISSDRGRMNVVSHQDTSRSRHIVSALHASIKAARPVTIGTGLRLRRLFGFPSFPCVQRGECGSALF
jgi:hypothetical protein